MKMKNLMMVLVTILLLAGIMNGEVFAAAPSGPVSGTIEVSGTENWASDVFFTGDGRLIISGDLTLEGSIIGLNGTLTGDAPLITVKEGGSLTLCKKSRFDLSGVRSVSALLAEQNGKFIVDDSEISGLDNDSGRSDHKPFLIEGGELQIVNGSRIENNQKGYVKDCTRYWAQSFARS